MKSPIHILLLDDDPMSNLINERLFQISGYDVKISTFVDADDALELLHQIIDSGDQNFPDIIFADINMDDTTGWEFAEELTKLPGEYLEKFSLYMLTSSIDQEDVKKSNSYSVIKGVISKPLTEELVVRCISKLIFH